MLVSYDLGLFTFLLFLKCKSEGEPNVTGLLECLHKQTEICIICKVTVNTYIVILSNLFPWDKIQL